MLLNISVLDYFFLHLKKLVVNIADLYKFKNLEGHLNQLNLQESKNLSGVFYLDLLVEHLKIV